MELNDTITNLKYWELFLSVYDIREFIFKLSGLYQYTVTVAQLPSNYELEQKFLEVWRSPD